jgi:tetratricopeptide (TPR) repeat protein
MNLKECYENGEAYNAKGDYDKAMECFEMTIRLNPDNAIKAMTYHNMGVVYWNMEKYDEAKVYYLKAIEENSSFAPAYYHLALWYYYHGGLTRGMCWTYIELAAKFDYIPAMQWIAEHKSEKDW